MGGIAFSTAAGLPMFWKASTSDATCQSSDISVQCTSTSFGTWRLAMSVRREDSAIGPSCIWSL